MAVTHAYKVFLKSVSQKPLARYAVYDGDFMENPVYSSSVCEMIQGLFLSKGILMRGATTSSQDFKQIRTPVESDQKGKEI